ncbi:unnamed protein product [Chrysoparadoxa australica]
MSGGTRNGLRARSLTRHTAYARVPSDHDAPEVDNGELEEPETVPFRHEFLLALREGFWIILLWSIVAGASTLAIAIFMTSDGGASNREMQVTRPVPTKESQESLRNTYMSCSTHIAMQDGNVVLQGLTRAPEGGHRRPPVALFEGIHIGVSAWHRWGVQLGKDESMRRNRELRSQLMRLSIAPSAIYDSSWKWDTSGFYAEGYVLQYTFDDLLAAAGKKVHSRKDPAWAEVEAKVLEVMRKWEQFIVFEYYPAVWGKGTQEDRHLHTNILQEVKTVRTGLDVLHSTTVVHSVD